MLLLLVAVWLLLCTGPLLDWRRSVRRVAAGAVLTLVIAGVLVLARMVLGWTIDLSGFVAAPLVTGEVFAAWPGLTPFFFGSPLHFLASTLMVGGLAALAASSLELWRLVRRGRGRSVPDDGAAIATMVLVQVAAGGIVAGLVVAYGAFIRFGIAAIPTDILHFGLRPLDWARLGVLVGIIALNAAVTAIGVVVLRLAAEPWTLAGTSIPVRVLAWLAWLVVPVTLVASGAVSAWTPAVPTILGAAFIAAVAARVTRIRASMRNASQAARLLTLVLGLVLPSLAFYPSLVEAAGRARRVLVETRFAPEVLEQRRTLQAHLAEALADIDRLPGLADLVRGSDPVLQGAPPVDAAFLVWSQTELARLRLTSSVELYAATGAIVSRFALKLPEIAGAPAATDVGCAWDIFEEVSPFFAEERRLLHAGRGVCVTEPDGRTRRVGEVVVHLMLDYGNLSFVSAQSPYVAVLGPGGTTAPELPLLTPVTFTVYGWSRKVLYASASRADALDEATFSRAVDSREPFWTEVSHEGRRVDAYVLNDRGGIYVLSIETSSGFGHLIVMAELVSLAFLTFIGAVLAGVVFGTVAARTPASGRALLREVRASFYRKLFLAFVAAAVVPVVALAFVARAYFASLMIADIEMEATRMANVASRVVEDFGSLQTRGLATLPAVDDNIVVWLSRVVAQDVNVFDGPRLLASSERNLFASGLLSTRTPAEAYQAILLEGRPSFVGRESVGEVEYLVAAAPVRIETREAILMVPLTSRQQEIEGQIEELDRRVLLAALLFIMLGAGIGYSMAERIADPVNRLMRATQRIARGDLDARVLSTSGDELRRLVDAFNRMAEDLRQQRGELERTNRLAAWADMARQVAHDIKNPLTPIQLNAEHLLRVHADRGRPLGSLVDDCVANILGQVRLLRQISAEFSSFASSPQPHPAPVSLEALLTEIVEPYTAGLAGRVAFEVALPAGLPDVEVDRLLIARALTNIIENALHAMPNGGTLRFTGVAESGTVRLDVTDTGVGMDAAAVARIFEPYFSTKTSGTGLGLTIAKRNVEANGGRIHVRSERGVGTTVSMELPAAGGARVS
ncbi:MAG: ATP-binding protein [Vicinamibacterales bacterium]